MGSSGIIHIVIGIVLFFPILIFSQMLLPFPYGMVFGITGAIAILVIFIIAGTKKMKNPDQRLIEKNIYCTKCGKQNPSINKFCNKCGQKLNDI